MTGQLHEQLAAQWLSNSTVLDLSHPYEVGMPQSPNHPPFRLALERRHGDVTRADGGSASNEIVVLGGHVGTHVDALAHVSHHGRLFGSVPVESVQSNRGFTKMGIDEFDPYVGRAVLLDVAASLGVDGLEPGYEITPDDLQAAIDRAAVEINPGDVVLIGTGWSARWSDRKTFIGQRGGAPGPGVAAAEWLIRQRPRAIGAETIAFEHIPPGAGHALLPVHRMLLVEQGINIIETMNLGTLRSRGVSEFLLILNPLLLVGATGAPVRPLAILT